jgi:hypothetical protein
MEDYISIYDEYPSYKRHLKPKCACCRPQNCMVPPPPPPVIKRTYCIKPTPVIIDEPCFNYSCCGEVTNTRHQSVRSVRFLNDCGEGCGCNRKPIKHIRRCYKYKF